MGDAKTQRQFDDFSGATKFFVSSAEKNFTTEARRRFRLKPRISLKPCKKRTFGFSFIDCKVARRVTSRPMRLRGPVPPWLSSFVCNRAHSWFPPFFRLRARPL